MYWRSRLYCISSRGSFRLNIQRGQLYSRSQKGLRIIHFVRENVLKHGTHFCPKFSTKTVEGLIKIWETESYGIIFELGRGRKFSLNEAAKLYKPSFGITYLEDKKGEAQSVECNNELAKKHLGWQAKNNLEDWIKNR